jgi:FkbM family methyltransferase
MTLEACARGFVLSRLITDGIWERPRDLTLVGRMLGGARMLIIDVGARGGLHERWRPYADLVDMIGFEADAAECERLTRSDRTGGHVRFLPYALGDSEGRRTFYVCAEPRCSGLYPPNERFVASFAPAIAQAMKLVRQLEFDVVPLDTIAAKEGLTPAGLKIDVQGAEVDVLRGGIETLRGTKIVELEVEFNPQYLGQPLFSEVDRYMREQGFALLGLRRTFWRRREAISAAHSPAGGQIVHGDALYFNERLLRDGDGSPRTLTEWLLLFGAYRQHDFVLTLLANHPGAETLDESTRQQLRAAFAPPTRRVPRAIKALMWPVTRGVPHHLLRLWLDAARPATADDWHDPEFF